MSQEITEDTRAQSDMRQINIDMSNDVAAVEAAVDETKTQAVVHPALGLEAVLTDDLLTQLYNQFMSLYKAGNYQQIMNRKWPIKCINKLLKYLPLTPDGRFCSIDLYNTSKFSIN